jgi:hypothetical protein
MPKLNQIIAIEDAAKKSGEADLTKSYHTLQKAELFTGFISTYSPLNEEGQKYAEQRKVIQQNAKDILKQIKASLEEAWNVVATKDRGNTKAKADVVVDGAVLLTDVPVTHLLYLEKQLVNIRTFVTKLPVLDPSKEWVFDTNKDMYVTVHTDEKIKTRKVHKSLVKIPPGPHSPGDAEIITVDEPEGKWTQVDMSTAYPAYEIREILERITKLQMAVKFAREEANSISVDKVKDSGKLLDYIFD